MVVVASHASPRSVFFQQHERSGLQSRIEGCWAHAAEGRASLLHVLRILRGAP